MPIKKPPSCFETRWWLINKLFAPQEINQSPINLGIPVKVSVVDTFEANFFVGTGAWANQVLQ